VKFSSLIGWCKLHEFILFFPTLKKEKGNPTHIAAHLQAHTSRRSNQRLTKELQFFYGAYFLSLSLYINILM